MDSMDEGNDECDIDSPRDLGTVFEVERCEIGHELFDGATWGQQFRLCCHRSEGEILFRGRVRLHGTFWNL